jgi:S1-C subfamily serine protease
MLHAILVTTTISAIGFLSTDALASDQNTDLLRKSVINFNCKIEKRDPTRPWLPYPGYEISGSGVVIAPGKILTNSHVVHEAKEILLETDQTPLPINGTVVAIDLGRDLALVEISDQDFIDAHPPIPLMEGLPADGSDIVVMGYPMGGETLSTTTGVVSRCEWEQSGRNMEEGMRVQVDAAINPGNSGGPGFVNNQIAGISVSGPAKSRVDNIAYMIATEEIQRFLREADDGIIDGNSILNIRYQDLKNPALRKKLGVDSSVSGVVILSEDSELFEPWDILTSVNGYTVENDAQITIEENRKVSVNAAVGRFDPLIHGEVVAIEILRDGEPVEIQYPATNGREAVIQNRPNGNYPYIVVGPLVFGPMHSELLNAHMMGDSNYIYWYGKGPFIEHFMDSTPADGKEIVTLLSPLLSHPVGRGYDVFAGQTVKSINGEEFDNFTEFVDIIANLEDEWIVIKFNEEIASTLVFNRNELYESTADVMESNGIRRAASKGFRNLWSVDD